MTRKFIETFMNVADDMMTGGDFAYIALLETLKTMAEKYDDNCKGQFFEDLYKEVLERVE